MRILVVYDTGSANRNTERVAKAMSEVLKEKGFDVDCSYVKDVDTASVKKYDFVLAGGPTQWLKATGPVTRFLERFAEDEFSGKLAAAFDTQLQLPLSGNAAKGIETKLRKLGFEIIMPPLVTYVESSARERAVNGMRLKEGEIEKAKKYAEDLANKLRQ